MASLGIKAVKTKLQSRGFVKVEKARAIDKGKLPPLPRRSLYE